MKKIFLLACLAAVFVFASCKSTEQDASAADDSSAQTEQTQDASSDAADQAALDMMSQTEAARQSAIDAGAKEYYADAFAQTDLAFDALKALKDGKNHDAELAEIKARYDALAKASAAKKLKERIDSEGLAANAQADYDHGEKALGEFDTMVKDPLTQPKKLSSKAAEAYEAYYDVFFKSYKKFANDERKLAVAQKKRADAVKAQVARKDEYKACAELITKGDSLYSTLNPEGAYNSYKKATESFKALADDVEQKRASAQKAIEEAKAKVKEAGEYALQADSANPLEAKVDGIEDDDAVLLEEDKFKTPEEQIIQIDENIEGEAR